MPKQIYNQTDFSGGVNGIDSPRDVQDNQVIRSKSVTFDEKGRIRMMGAMINSSIPGTALKGSADNKIAFEAGTSFFVFSHDYNMLESYDTGVEIDNSGGYAVNTTSAMTVSTISATDHFSAGDEVLNINGSSIGMLTAVGSSTSITCGTLGTTTAVVDDENLYKLRIDTTPSASPTEFYVIANNEYIAIFDSSIPYGWLHTAIDMGGDQGDGDRQTGFYFADSALRCYNKTFDTAVFSRWHGHIKRNLYESADADKIVINEWYTTTTKLLTPAAGAFNDTIGSEVPGKVLMTYGGSGDSALGVTADTLTVHWNALDTIPGTWLAGTYKWYISHIYDGSQESQVYETTMTTAIGGDTGTKSVCLGVSSNWLNDGTFNKRITGARVYYSDPVDGHGIKYHMLDIDLVKGCRKFNETDWTDWDLDSSGNYECPTALIGTGGTASFMNLDDVFVFEDMPKTVTYDMLNGYSPTEVTDAEFKCHTIFNNRVYIGNIQQDGNTYPDRVIRSPINFEGNPQYDTFPATHKMDVAANDGDSITALEGFGDRLLIFKTKSVYVINVAQDGTEFVENKFSDLGVKDQSQVTSTEYGVVWINNKGCYLYSEGKNINLIDSAFFASKARGITPSMKWNVNEAKFPAVNYMPRDKKLIVSIGLAGEYSNDALIYDFLKKAWSFGGGVCGDWSKRRSNFVVNSDGVVLMAQLATADYPNSTFNIMQWNDSPQTNNEFTLWFKDLDFGQPNVRKKVYKAYLQFRANGATNVKATYCVNGNYLDSLLFATTTSGGGLEADGDGDQVLTESASGLTDKLTNGSFDTASTVNGALAADTQTALTNSSWRAIADNAGGEVHLGNRGSAGLLRIKNDADSDVLVYQNISVDTTTNYRVTFYYEKWNVTHDEHEDGIQNTDLMCFITTEGGTSGAHSDYVSGSNDVAFKVVSETGLYSFPFTTASDTTLSVVFRAVKNDGNDPSLFANWDAVTDAYSQNIVHSCSVFQEADWSRAELKPNTSSQANNVYSFGLKLDVKSADGSDYVPSGFEIDNLSVVYRTKNIK